MTDIIIVAAVLTSSAGTFAGGWLLRGLRDRYRAGTERNPLRDQAHPPAADRGG